MSAQAVLLPVFVLIALTFALMFWMGYARVTAVRRGEARIGDIALGQSNWPERVTLIGNSYANQFQLPILFYILVALAWEFRQADLLFVVLSWLFVLARLAHAFVHVSTNRVPRRLMAFAVGAVILLAMWIIFAIRVLVA